MQNLVVFLNFDSSGIAKKARRQKWPYYEESHPGSPIHIYPLETLPDDIQIAWANWDRERFNLARITEELKGESGKVAKIPQPVSRELAEQALAMPVRESWIKQYAPGQKPRQGSKVYDGKSKGLCPKAREILLKRFSDLKDIKPGQSVSVSKPSETVRDIPDKYRISAGSVTQEQTHGLRELKQEIKDLKGYLKDCSEDKKYIREMQDQRLTEKDKLIEELKLQLGRQTGKVEQLAHQIEELHEELHQKNDRLLQAATGQKREPHVQSEAKTPPPTAKRHTK